MTLEEQLTRSLDLVRLRGGIGGLPRPLPKLTRAASASLDSRLPVEKYYTGTDLFVPLPPLQPVDETRPLSPSDLDARRLAADGRAGMIRFFAGRYSRRLGRVVRPS